MQTSLVQFSVGGPQVIAAEELVRLEDLAAKTDNTVLSGDTISCLQTYLIEVSLFCFLTEILCSLSGVVAFAGHEGGPRFRGEMHELPGLRAASEPPCVPDRRRF